MTTDFIIKAIAGLVLGILWGAVILYNVFYEKERKKDAIWRNWFDKSNKK